MTINESRLHNGTLKLGPTAGQIDMSCQITNARITTAYSDDGDSVTVLCGDTKPAPRKMDGHTLAGTLIQDFDLQEAAGGVIDYLWNHDLEVVAYEYVPNDTAETPTISGTLMIEIPAETYGGDVNARITTDFEWNCQETPLRLYPGQTPPTNPKISALAPDTGPAGTAVDVTVTGTDFEATSKVEADGVAQTTSFVSATEVIASYTPDTPGTVQFTVRNADANESNNMPFDVT